MAMSDPARTAPAVRDWPAVDLTGVDFDPVLTALMREGPVTRITLPNGEGWAWLATRYHDVRLVTNDARFSRAAVVGRQVTRLAPHFIPAPRAISFVDKPEYARLRRVVNTALTPQAVERLRASARSTLHELIDRMLRDGPPADLIEQVLTPFPTSVICDVMGVPTADQGTLHAWTQRILSSTHGPEASEQAKHDMETCFTRLIALLVAQLPTVLVEPVGARKCRATGLSGHSAARSADSPMPRNGPRLQNGFSA